MINFCLFTREHFDLIEPDPAFEGVKSRYDVEVFLSRGSGVSLIDFAKGEVLACYGYLVRVPGVFWLWLLPSRRGSRNLIRVVRHTGSWMRSLPAGSRVEFNVRAAFKEGIRFAEILGFERETEEPARLYDGVEDFHLFSKICSEQDGNSAIVSHRSEFLNEHIMMSGLYMVPTVKRGWSHDRNHTL